MTEWVLIISTMLLIETGSGGQPGDILATGAFGSAETEALCDEAGEKLTLVLTQAAAGEAVMVFSCVELPQKAVEAIAIGQGWE